MQARLIAALGETDDAGVGTALAAAFGKLPADAQPAAFDALLKRADWANAFLDAVKAKQIDVADARAGQRLPPAHASRTSDVAQARRPTCSMN